MKTFIISCYKIQKINFVGLINYVIVDTKNILIASPEKALLDFLYFNANLNSLSKIASLTWNTNALKKLNWNLINQYQKVFNSQALNRRVELLKKTIA